MWELPLPWVEGISKEQSCYVSAMLQVQFHL